MMTQLHLLLLPNQQSSGPQLSPKNEEAIDAKRIGCLSDIYVSVEWRSIQSLNRMALKNALTRVELLTILLLRLNSSPTVR